MPADMAACRRLAADAEIGIGAAREPVTASVSFMPPCLWNREHGSWNREETESVAFRLSSLLPVPCSLFRQTPQQHANRPLPSAAPSHLQRECLKGCISRFSVLHSVPMVVVRRALTCSTYCTYTILAATFPFAQGLGFEGLTCNISQGGDNDENDI